MQFNSIHPVEIIGPNVYSVEDTDTFQNIDGFIQFKLASCISLTPIVEQIGKMWSIRRVSKPPLHIPACCLRTVLILNKIFTILSII